ncbi:Periphilin-1 [Turdus rufiventris]|nr:Periphilin-1 [Turdus rufiventris]
MTGEQSACKFHNATVPTSTEKVSEWILRSRFAKTDRKVMAYRRDEMWSEGRYDYGRVPRERLPPRIHGDGDYHRIVNVVPKKAPLLERPGDGNYSRYDDYGHANYRDYDEGRSFAHDRRNGPPHRGVRKDESGYRWARDDHPTRPEYRKSLKSELAWSSLIATTIEGIKLAGKERAVHSLKTSRDASPSGSTTVPSSKALEKSNRLSEKELAEAASKWAAEKSEKAEESNLPEITEYDAGSSAPVYIEQTEETEANLMDSTELYEDSHLLSRSKAIAAKTKAIEQVYRQDCETFGMVVKMLIDKDPSLEKSIQFALRQNLHEIGERCIEELKHFIAQYDAANQDVSEPFKEGSY